MTMINPSQSEQHASTPGAETSEGRIARATVAVLSAFVAVFVALGAIDETSAMNIMALIQPLIDNIAEIVAWYIGGRSALKAAGRARSLRGGWARLT